MSYNLDNFYMEVIDGELHTLVPPPHNFVVGNSTIINFHRNPTAMIANGWREWTDEELEEWHSRYDPAPPAPDPLQEEAYANFKSAMEIIAARYPDKAASFLAYCRQHGSIAIATWCAQNGVDADDIQLAINATMGTLHDLNNRQSFIEMLDRFEADMVNAQTESGGAE